MPARRPITSPRRCSATGALDNYIITNDGAEFTINKRLATWTTNANSKTYGDLDPVPLTTGSGSNFIAADNVTATYSRAAGENASPPTYHITATLSATGDLNNYIITNDGGEFTINKRAGDLDHEREQQDLRRSGSGAADHRLGQSTSSRLTA